MPPATPNQDNRHIADIEFLRALAIILVLIFHIRRELIDWPMPILEHFLDHYLNFWPGVDIFFAVSGFVIARTLIPSLQACVSTPERIRVMTRFWIRRAWRLLPSAWLWLALILLASALLNRSGAFEAFHVNFESVVAGMLSVANVRLGQLFPFKPYGPSSTYWSLSLEEQFYLVLPLLVIVARSRLVLVLAGLVAIVFCLPQTVLLGAFRVHAILLGVLLAIFSRHPAYRLLEPTVLGTSTLARWGTLGVALFLLTALAPFEQKIVPFSFDLIGLLAAALVFVASFDRDYLCRGVLLNWAMRWIGSRSYALYLVHMPAYCLTREIWFRLSPPGTVFGGSDALLFVMTAAPIVLVCAELNYRFIEMPGRRYGIRLTGGSAGAPAELASVAAPAEAVV